MARAEFEVFGDEAWTPSFGHKAGKRQKAKVEVSITKGRTNMGLTLSKSEAKDLRAQLTEALDKLA